MDAPGSTDVQMDPGESHESFIRVTNHGKMRSWIAFSLNFFAVSFISHGVAGIYSSA